MSAHAEDHSTTGDTAIDDARDDASHDATGVVTGAATGDATTSATAGVNTGATAGATAGTAAGTTPEPLLAGGLVPHFDVIDVDGRRRRYADIWQHRLLALVLLPEAESAASRAYQESLADVAPALGEMNTSLVVSAAAIDGLAPPGWLVADQFGEIQHAQQQADDPRDMALPAPDEVVQWVRYVRTRCG